MDKVVTLEDMRGFGPEKLLELVQDIRREIFDTRMNIYKPAGTSSAHVRLLKKNIARAKTVLTEKNKAANKVSPKKSVKKKGTKDKARGVAK